ncbi:MBL fold metallo-hydrolase [Alteromonas sp. KUL49]|uniref:MBL fold metallo-hydrolase n=1 Tax=Alteromonas sp. KUL49 TaxID=2480798 RepID=UPI00102F1213|nr:MBL fold metallo-hydrolase [Alteromonas sp. KUL49]TAP39395.1 MBL fold metallo-hydrolase [Alteromonas sp. KUL49]GEA12190.1 Zn-dependent hydrolase [Alteromonas sp. KUL49]
MKVHTLSGYIQHIYLVQEGDKLLLLDGCSRADVDMVCDFITDTLTLPLSALKFIVVTHMHPDHAGGAIRLRSRTGAQIGAHPKAFKWYLGLSGRIAHMIDIALAWWVASRLGKARQALWYNPKLNHDVVLKDEQRLPYFDDWQVIYSPGHTDHDLSLVHVPTKQAYVADLMVKVKGELVAPYPICHPNQYRRSLHRVANAQLETIFCAHVPPLKVQDIPFDDIIQNAPALPKNHWHSAKNRIMRKIGGRTESH